MRRSASMIKLCKTEVDLNLDKEHVFKQGKSGGFDSCNRRSNLTEIGFQILEFSAHVTSDTT